MSIALSERPSGLLQGRIVFLLSLGRYDSIRQPSALDMARMDDPRPAPQHYQSERLDNDDRNTSKRPGPARPPHGGPRESCRARILYRPDDAAGRTVNGLTYAMARALAEDGVLKNDWVGAGAGIAILGYEQAALDRFCAEVLCRLGSVQGTTQAARGRLMRRGRMGVISA
jgi:hypothetical protein